MSSVGSQFKPANDGGGKLSRPPSIVDLDGELTLCLIN